MLLSVRNTKPSGFCVADIEITSTVRLCLLEKQYLMTASENKIPENKFQNATILEEWPEHYELRILDLQDMQRRDRIEHLDLPKGIKNFGLLHFYSL